MLCSPWIVEDDLAGCDCDATALGEGQLEEVILAASEALYTLSGSRYSGVCVTTWRPPCHQTRYGLPRPVTFGGEWRNVYGCGCGTPLLLPADHPISVTVKVDGATFAAHRLDGRILRRTDGVPWPCCQNLDLPDTDVGTWSITITHGLAPPELGRLAARALTAELVRDCLGQDCKLPRGTSSFVRQGISGQVGLTQSAFGQQILQSGIYEVDLFLAADNPFGLRRRATFWSPDVPATLR